MVVSSARAFELVDRTSEQDTFRYAASLLRGNAAMWWREVCEANQRPAKWDDFYRELRAQFRPEDYGRKGRDDLATMRQYARESVADFVFRFLATCLKVPDLSEAEKTGPLRPCIGIGHPAAGRTMRPSRFSRGGDVR